MNELYGNNDQRPRSRRRWIYMVSALIILCVLMLLPGAATARLSLVIANENPAEVVMTPPKDCRLEKVYFKANEHVPRQGKLVTLIVNGLEFPVADFEKLPAADEAADAGFENRHAPIDWDKLKGAKSLTVSYKDVNKALQRYDLELVFQLTGNPDKIKNWQSFVQLYPHGTAPAAPKVLPAPESSK